MCKAADCMYDYGLKSTSCLRITTVSCAQNSGATSSCHSHVRGSQTGQRGARLAFARLFGLTAIIHSGLLLRNILRFLVQPPLRYPRKLRAVLGALSEVRACQVMACEPATGQSDAHGTVLRLQLRKTCLGRGSNPQFVLKRCFVEGFSADEGAPKSGNMSTPKKIALALACAEAVAWAWSKSGASSGRRPLSTAMYCI